MKTFPCFKTPDIFNSNPNQITGGSNENNDKFESGDVLTTDQKVNFDQVNDGLPKNQIFVTSMPMRDNVVFGNQEIDMRLLFKQIKVILDKKALIL